MYLYEKSVDGAGPTRSIKILKEIQALSVTGQICTWIFFWKIVQIT